MRKRTKFAINYALSGVFLGYLLYSFALVILWLFIGDGPTSPGMKLFENIFGIAIALATLGFWIYFIRLGYRRGIDAENALENKTGSSSLLYGGVLWYILLAIAMVFFFSPFILSKATDRRGGWGGTVGVIILLMVALGFLCFIILAWKVIVKEKAQK